MLKIPHAKTAVHILLLKIASVHGLTSKSGVAKNLKLLSVFLNDTCQYKNLFAEYTIYY